MSREQVRIAVDWKVASASPDSGEIEGVASVAGVIDHDGDVVSPRAFAKSIADWRGAKQPMPLIADHQLSTAGVVGSVTDLRDDGRALHFKARLSSVAKAQDLRRNLIEGHVRGVSYTALIVKSHPGVQNGQRVRFLDELALQELTVTPFPTLELAGVTVAKSDGGIAR